MRDLSEQEIKELYESEYRNVPDVWDKVTDRIEMQGQEKKKGSVTAGTEYDGDEEGTLHFERLGKKRWAKLLAAMAACFVIIIAYVLETGNLMKGDTGNTETAPPWDDEMLLSEPATASADGDDAYRYDADISDGDAAAGAGVVEEAESAVETDGIEGSDEMQKNDPETVADLAEIHAWINVSGGLYVYDEACMASAAELEDMEYLGECVCVADKAALKEHLYLAGLEVNGRVYRSSTGEIYVLDESTGQVYGFREE